MVSAMVKVTRAAATGERAVALLDERAAALPDKRAAAPRTVRAAAPARVSTATAPPRAGSNAGLTVASNERASNEKKSFPFRLSLQAFSVSVDCVRCRSRIQTASFSLTRCSRAIRITVSITRLRRKKNRSSADECRQLEPSCCSRSRIAVPPCSGCDTPLGAATGA